MSETFTWPAGSGSLTLLPSRGRVLQASLGGHDAYWVNEQEPALAGWNAGGDRLWAAPELDWFWKTRTAVDFDQYEIPAALDPAPWFTEDHQPGYCRVTQNVELPNQHDGQVTRFKRARNFELVALNQAPFFEIHLAYRTDNELSIKSGPEDQCLDSWSILQLPPGGTLWLGTSGEGVPRDYFAPVPASMWGRDADALHFEINGAQQYKVGVAPHHSNGRMAYTRPVDGQLLVIYRQFWVQPWRFYCDWPMLSGATQGDAVQIYNDDGNAGGFGEMEYHSPALRIGQGPQQLIDSNLTIVGLVSPDNWLPWRAHWLGA